MTSRVGIALRGVVSFFLILVLLPTHSPQSTIPMDVLTTFERAEGEMSKTHVAYVQSFTLTRPEPASEDGEDTVQFLLALHSQDTPTALWSTLVTLPANGTFVGTPNASYAGEMYFRASAVAGQEVAQFGFAMSVRSVLVPQGDVPTLSVAKALNATGDSLAEAGSYDSTVNNFDATLVCKEDADLDVTATSGSVSAVGQDLVLHVASHTEEPLVVRCVNGSAVVISCTAPCALHWGHASPTAEPEEENSDPPTLLWTLVLGSTLVLCGVALLVKHKYAALNDDTEMESLEDTLRDDPVDVAL